MLSLYLTRTPVRSPYNYTGVDFTPARFPYIALSNGRRAVIGTASIVAIFIPISLRRHSSYPAPAAASPNSAGGRFTNILIDDNRTRSIYASMYATSSPHISKILITRGRPPTAAIPRHASHTLRSNTRLTPSTYARVAVARRFGPAHPTSANMLPDTRLTP